MHDHAEMRGYGRILREQLEAVGAYGPGPFPLKVRRRIRRRARRAAR